MTASVIFQEQVEIPLDVGTLREFRRWALSSTFPECGRIDFIDGRIEVDMTPENIFSHGTLKTKMAATLLHRVEQLGLGHVLIDSARIANVAARLSVEPDIVMVSQAAIDEGRIRLVPAASGEPGQFVELEGSPDLLVEIVSDNSMRKDTQRLPTAYFAAGVREYWLVDARGETLEFQILRRGAAAFEPVQRDADDFQESLVLQCRCHLDRRPGLGGFWKYDLTCR